MKKIINESRKHVATYVNTTMLFTYWNIGKMIVEEQGGSSKAKYGNKLIAELSKQMTLDFGKGFYERNLRKMRQFYLMYPIWDSVRPELTWTHYRTLIRIEEQYIRSFYIDRSILDRLIGKKSNENIIIYNNTKTSKVLQNDINTFNKQYGLLKIINTNKVHDRYIIIDKLKIYHIGASIKDLGKKIFSIIESDSKLIAELLKNI